MVVPKSLQAQAIAIAHEGHMQMDGTMRQLRESQWFKNMRPQVQAFMSSCKCQTANPHNPKPPLPKVPWLIIDTGGTCHEEYKYGRVKKGAERHHEITRHLTEWLRGSTSS